MIQKIYIAVSFDAIYFKLLSFIVAEENESRLCKFCQKPYSTLKSLKQHEKSHKNETTLFSERTKTKKQFKCTFCKSAFDTKNECTAHQHKEHANSLSKYLAKHRTFRLINK